jgi:1-deoxy-D-xylulose-5-phosphate reductoisomerase
VDSATGINKAFEVIELGHLFKVKPEQIEIVAHPEYLCHSLVEFVDGSILTELGVPDMKRYLQYALFYPERRLTKVSNFVNLAGQQLTFEKPPYEKFPCLRLGFEALQAGGTMPAVLHGADRAVVEKFVAGKIRFTEIYSLIKATLKKHQVIKKPKLTDLIEAEDWGYKHVQTT